MNNNISFSFLLILALFWETFFLINGCSRSQEQPTLLIPKFRYGTPVYVSNGFFEGAKGRIEKFRIDGGRILYEFDGYLNSVDGKYHNWTHQEFPESELVEDVSGE